MIEPRWGPVPHEPKARTVVRKSRSGLAVVPAPQGFGATRHRNVSLGEPAVGPGRWPTNHGGTTRPGLGLVSACRATGNAVANVDPSVIRASTALRSAPPAGPISLNSPTVVRWPPRPPAPHSAAGTPPTKHGGITRRGRNTTRPENEIAGDRREHDQRCACRRGGSVGVRRRSELRLPIPRCLGGDLGGRVDAIVDLAGASKPGHSPGLRFSGWPFGRMPTESRRARRRPGAGRSRLRRCPS